MAQRVVAWIATRLLFGWLSIHHSWFVADGWCLDGQWRRGLPPILLLACLVDSGYLEYAQCRALRILAVSSRHHSFFLFLLVTLRRLGQCGMEGIHRVGCSCSLAGALCLDDDEARQTLQVSRRYSASYVHNFGNVRPDGLALHPNSWWTDGLDHEHRRSLLQ